MGEASSTHLCTATENAALLRTTSCLTAIAPTQWSGFVISAALGALPSAHRIILHVGQITGIFSSPQESSPRWKIRRGFFESGDALSGNTLPSAPNLATASNRID